MFRILLLILFFYAIVTTADGETGSNRIGSGQCPDNAEAIMVYSPFKPYWKFGKFKNDIQNCWVATDCLFESAGESRKQQFAAAALVMGVIPFTSKNVEWPKDSTMQVTKRLPWLYEILVLALGLVPLPKNNPPATRTMNGENNVLAEYAREKGKSFIYAMVITLTVCLLACYAGLMVNELYSKRSALGCVFPFFITAWYVAALIPASIHRSKITSAVEVSDKDWRVQMAWSIYYIAGTLIFTSIMAVTIIELLVWVVLCVAATSASRLLAFYICLIFEETVDKH
jgi:hypothetical protein